MKVNEKENGKEVLDEEGSGDTVLGSDKHESIKLNHQGLIDELNKLDTKGQSIKEKLGMVSIEGIDRSGKTTINNKLLQYYEKDKDIKFKKFPDKTSAYGRMVYELLESDLGKYKENYCLYNSFDKNQGIERIIERGNNGVLILDRFDVTQYVYGKGLGVHNPLDYLRYESDEVIYIDISVEESLRRGNQLGDNDLIEEDVTILERVYKNYQEYLDEIESKGRQVHLINGNLSEDEIFKQVIEIIEGVKPKYV